VDRHDRGFRKVDTMASALAPYGNAKALEVARDLDSKVINLLNAAT
jgi:hypothetical protein